MAEMPLRTGTDAAPVQDELIACAWIGCNVLFAPRFPGQKFHKPKCKAAYAREVGLVGTIVSARRLRTRNSIVIHTTDDRALEAPLGTRFRLVREP